MMFIKTAELLILLAISLELGNPYLVAATVLVAVGNLYYQFQFERHVRQHGRMMQDLIKEEMEKQHGRK